MSGSTRSAAALDPATFGVRPTGWLRRLVTAVVRLAVGTLLCLTPFTAIVALGWMQRLMRREAMVTVQRRTAGVDRREAIRRLARDPATAELAVVPGWFSDATAAGFPRRALGGLWRNISEGIVAFGAVVATTLVFAMPLLGAWWAGWENSFNKGYEQSSAGPLVWLLGAVLMIASLRYLPMATAHAANEKRLAALAEVRRIRALTGAAGLSLVWPVLMIALGSLAVLGLRLLPIALQQPGTGFADIDDAGIERVKSIIALVSAATVFGSALLYRVAAARAYGRALSRLGGAAVAGDTVPNLRSPGRVVRFIAAAVVLALSVLVVAALLVGQFMNHSWVLWTTYPVFGVPWLP